VHICILLLGFRGHRPQPRTEQHGSALFFPLEALGKKVSHVIDQHLRPIRLRIAHAVLDSGELTLSPDEPNEERELIKWLPLAKCVARRMLKNDFSVEFLGYLHEYGTIGSPQP